jgi:type IV pilus assembly protein PilB
MLTETNAKALADSLLLEFIDLDAFADNDFLLQALPENVMRDYQLLPLQLDHDKVIIAVANLSQSEKFNDIASYFSQSIIYKIVEADKLAKRIASLLHHRVQEHLTEDAPIVDYVEKLLADAVNKNASDVHLESYQDQLRIRLRIDGVLYETAKLSAQLAPRLIAHLKILAQLDITERRLPQDGRLQIPMPKQQVVDCRLSTCPVVQGEKLVLRILNLSQLNLTIEALGLAENIQTLFLRTIQKPQGLILVTGPTGSGKTVTLYTALKILNQPSVNICSVEDPVEIELIGINQVQINYQIELSFASVLRAFLRQDPDIIMVGEMRDAETAEIAIKAAQTGHLVLSTLHTNSAAESLTRLAHMGMPAYHLAASISLIIAQRLVRRLCEYCKAIDEVDHGLNFTSYCAVGCAKCQQGFYGRTAIYEFLPISKSMAEIIVQHADSLTIEKQARVEGMQTLFENGLLKVQQGITSYAELLRVTMCDQHH